MTWNEIKLATLQKMFSSSGLKINEQDESIREYILAMPQAANEAIQLLSTAGKFIRKQFSTDEPGLFDMSIETFDFYSFGDLEVYDVTDDAMTPMRNASTSSGRYLHIPKGFKGEAVCFYNAYPQQITQETPDDTVIALDPEVVVLLPLYMASQLYKDDDNTLSTQYRNEFEAAFDRLKNRSAAVVTNEFTSTTGWK